MRNPSPKETRERHRRGGGTKVNPEGCSTPCEPLTRELGREGTASVPGRTLEGFQEAWVQGKAAETVCSERCLVSVASLHSRLVDHSQYLLPQLPDSRAMPLGGPGARCEPGLPQCTVARALARTLPCALRGGEPPKR